MIRNFRHVADSQNLINRNSRRLKLKNSFNLFSEKKAQKTNRNSANCNFIVLPSVCEVRNCTEVF